MESHHSSQFPKPAVSVSRAAVTWDVPESSDDAVVLVVDDAGSPPLDAAAIPHFALSGPHTLRSINLEKN